MAIKDFHSDHMNVLPHTTASLDCIVLLKSVESEASL
jgi:hypothetical protein